MVVKYCKMYNQEKKGTSVDSSVMKFALDTGQKWLGIDSSTMLFLLRSARLEVDAGQKDHNAQLYLEKYTMDCLELC